MAIVKGYATLDELIDWNGGDQIQDELKLENAITATSRGIDNHCQRHFWQDVAAARYFDTDDAYMLKLGAFNDLVSITTLKTDENADGVFETTWAATDYQRLPLNLGAAPEAKPSRKIKAISGRTFPSPSCTGREGLIEIVGTWGWAAVPQNVFQACLIHASRIFKRKDSPEGVAGWGDFGAIRVGKTDPDVLDLLQPYRHVAVLVA